MNKRAIGTEYEQNACEFLETQGFEIVERNYHCKVGEIDIIARQGEVLVFIEVKYLKDLRMGSPLEAIDRRKQRTIRRVAMHYLYERCLSPDIPIRFDAIGILGENLEHIKDAF